MGNGNSVEVPGGGTEGYHVLRVSCPFAKWKPDKSEIRFRIVFGQHPADV